MGRVGIVMSLISCTTAHGTTTHMLRTVVVWVVVVRVLSSTAHAVTTHRTIVVWIVALSSTAHAITTHRTIVVWIVVVRALSSTAHAVATHMLRTVVIRVVVVCTTTHVAATHWLRTIIIRVVVVRCIRTAAHAVTTHRLVVWIIVVRASRSRTHRISSGERMTLRGWRDFRDVRFGTTTGIIGVRIMLTLRNIWGARSLLRACNIGSGFLDLRLVFDRLVSGVFWHWASKLGDIRSTITTAWRRTMVVRAVVACSVLLYGLGDASKDYSCKIFHASEAEI